MRGSFLPSLAAENERRAMAALQRAREDARGYGLILTEADAAAVVRANTDALDRTGRIEFGEPLPARLLEAFASSPYLSDAQTLCDLTEIFYECKNAVGDGVGDGELLSCMRRAFDGRCGGAADAVADEVLAHFGRMGGAE